MEEEVEVFYAKQGLGLSDHSDTDFCRSIVICTLQHLSKKPYLSLSLAENDLLNFMTEWDHLTQDIGQSNINFLYDLRKIERRHFNDPSMCLTESLNTVSKYFNRNFHIISEDFKDGTWTSEAIFETDDSTSSILNSEKIRMLYQKNDVIYRLISDTFLLHPQPISHAENLIDTLIRCKVVQFLLRSDQERAIDLQKDPSHSLLFGELHSLSEKLKQTKSFSEIFEAIPANAEAKNEYASIFQRLIKLEKEISIVDRASLRVKLIHLVYTEMFLPLRTAILEEKETQERIAIDSSERRRRNITHAQNLQGQLVQSAAQLQQLEAEVEEAQATNQQVLINKAQELRQIKEKLQNQKEEAEFTQFLNTIIIIQPTFDMIEELLDLRESFATLSLRQMVTKLVSTFNLHQSDLLKSRISKDLTQDRDQLVDAFDEICKLPVVRQDSETVLSITGVHVIFSTILSQIQQSLTNCSTTEELQFHITGNFILDASMTKKYFSGKKVVIVAQSIVIAESIVEIDVSGHNAVELTEPKALDAVNDGGSGIPGDNGNAGENGGSVYIEALNSNIANYNHLTINVSGGKGANGQHGGHGKDGKNGSNGTNAKWPGSSTITWAVGEQYEIRRGTKGTTGQKGGIGGVGGLGGEGGKSGTIEILPTRCRPYDNINATNGQPGTDGQPGRDGKPGTDGKDGFDFGWAQRYWYSSCHSLEGYNIYAEKRYGTFGIPQGYELCKGEPNCESKSQQSQIVTSAQKQSARKCSSALKAIDSNTIAQVRAAVKTGALGQSEIDQSSIDNTEQEALALQAEFHEKQKSSLTDLQNKMTQKNEALRLQQELAKQQALSNVAASEAEKQNLEALELAEKYSKLDKELETQHKSANKNLVMAQQQVVFQAQQSKTTTTLCASTTQGETSKESDQNNVKLSGAAEFTARSCENVEEDSCYKLFTRLDKLYHGNEKLNQVEDLLQCLILEYGQIPKIYEAGLLRLFKDFLSRKDSEEGTTGDKYQSYLTEKFLIDFKTCYELEDWPATKTFLNNTRPKFQTFFQLVLHYRLSEGTDRNYPSWTELRLPPLLRKTPISKELEDEQEFQKILQQVLPGDGTSKSDATEDKPSKWNLLAKIKGKSSTSNVAHILELGRQLYVECYDKFGSSGFNDTMDSFLQKFRNDVKIDDDGDIDNEAVGKSLMKLDIFTFKHMKKVLSSPSHSKEERKYLENLPSILPNLVLSSDQCQQLLDVVTTETKFAKIREAILANFKEKIEQRHEDAFDRLRNSSAKKAFQRYMNMVESEHLNLRLADRKKYYQAVVSKESALTAETAMKSLTVELYENLTNGSIGNKKNSFDVAKFLQDAYTQRIDQTFFRKMAFILENGKISENEIVEFSTKELSDFENFIKSAIPLTDDEDLAFEVLELISEKTVFDKILISNKINLQGNHNTVREILQKTRNFVKEAEQVEGCNVTDFARTQKYIKFSLARLQLVLARIGKSEDMSILKEKLDKAENLTKIIRILDAFYDSYRKLCNFQHVKISATTFLEFLPEASQLLIALTSPTPLIVAEFLLKISEYIQLVNNKLDETNSKTFSDFLQQISKWCAATNNVTWVKYFYSFLNTAAGLTDYPINILQERIRFLQLCQIQLNSFIDFCIQQISKLKNTKLYIVATFVNTLMDDILKPQLGDISTFNIEVARRDVDALMLKLCSVNYEDSARIQRIKYCLLLESQRFPFFKDWKLFIETCYRSSTNQQNQILKTLLKFWSDLPNRNETRDAIQRKSCEIFNRDLPPGQFTDLFQIFMKYIEDPVLSRLIIRLFENSTSLHSGQLKQLHQLGQQHQPISAALFMKTLSPTLEGNGFEVFANSAEIALIKIIANFESKHSKEILMKKVESLLQSRAPEHWKKALEKLLLEINIERFLDLTSSLSQEQSFGKTVKLVAAKEGKKKALRILQRVNVGLAFETALFFIPPPQRQDWFVLLNKIYKSAKTQSVSLFTSSRDCIKFFKLSMDLKFERFRQIIHLKFPFHWLKWMLIEFFDEMLTTGGVDETEVTQINSLIKSFLSSQSPSKLSFLFLLREHLLTEKRNSLSVENWVDVKRLKRIFEKVGELNLTGQDITVLKPLLLSSPFSYWPKILRLTKFQRKSTSRYLVYKFLAMDEKFGEQLVDSLVTNVPSLFKLTEPQIDFILGKIMSGEWILDQQNIAHLQEILTKNDFTDTSSLENMSPCFDKLVKYTTTKRSKELDVPTLIQDCLMHPLNDAERSTVNLIRQRLQKILLLLGFNSKTAEFYIDDDTMSYDTFETKVKSWIKSTKNQTIKWSSKTELDDNLVCRTICVIYRAIQFHWVTESWNKLTPDEKKKCRNPLKNSKKPRCAQILSLLFLISGRNKGGKMGEIDTGEGKSLIVAMFAAFTVIFSARVHVITSNKVLAEDGANEFPEFFKLFDFTVNNNCDSKITSEAEKKKRYNNHIVFGDIGSFQADHLNTSFYDKKIIESKADVVIVDEVDSLLLDKASNMLYLSHSIPELKNLRPVILIIWEAVQRRVKAESIRKLRSGETNNAVQYTESDVNSVKEAVVQRLIKEKGHLKIPSCLEDFNQRRIGIWVKQAFKAHFMPLNENFIVSTSSSTKVINMDNSTGVEQVNMHLQLGLQQFLQLRYLAKLTPETLKCVYISNTKYLEGYKGKIFGITGTIGDEDEREILTANYDTTFFGMPKFRPGKRIEFPAKIASDDSTWLSNICDSINEHPNQPILIISENNAMLEKINTFITENGRRQLGDRFIGRIHRYQSSEKDTKLTKEIADREIPGLNSNELVLSTNLGGRGTDFKINKSIQDGLHVILTYLPSNLRVQKQAFGRAARAGEAGTVQFVIMETDTSLTIEELLEKRNIREIYRLSQVKRESNRINLEDKLFEKYTDFFKKVRESPLLKRYPKLIRKQQLEFLNNRWALWVDSVRENLELLHLRGDSGREAIFHKFEKFCDEMNTRLNSPEDVCCFAEFPSELTKLGIQYEKVGTKTVIGSALSFDLDGIAEISDQTWENFTEGVKFIGGVTKGVVMLNKEKINDVIATKRSQSAIKFLGTDLDLGINLLEDVRKRDLKLSEAATTYLATLHIQRDATARKNAKQFLTEAREKILDVIEHNYSYVQLLQDASAHDSNSHNTKNCFKQQMESESNILQFHINSIDSALQLPLSPSFFKTRMRSIEMNDEGNEIYRDLLEEVDHVKPFRKCKEVTEEQWTKLKSRSLPCIMEKLVEKLNTLDSKITEDSFKDLVWTKEKLYKQLLDVNFVQAIDPRRKYYIVSIDAQRYVDFKNNFPEEFGPELESILKVQLYKRMGQEYKGSEIFSEVTNPPEINLVELQNFLIEQKCIELSPNYALVIIKKDNILLDNNGDIILPEQNTTLPHFKKILRYIFLDEKCKARKQFFMDEIPLSNSVLDGSRVIFKTLLTLKIIREPVLNFKRQPSHDETQAKITAIKTWLTGMKSNFKRIFRKYHPEKTSDKEFDAYYNEITVALLDSIGSIKKYPHLKVYYKDLMSEMLLAQSEPSEELNEFMAEGIFAEVFEFEELVRWYHNTGALLIVVLGVIEIAAGVAVEFCTAGALSPLAQFLVSQGGADIFYSLKQLYHGKRVDSKHYLQYKMESIALSAVTCWIPGGTAVVGETLKDLAVSIGNVLLKEFAWKGGKAVLFGFIDENRQRAVERNLFGVNNLLDSIMDTAEFRTEMEHLMRNAKTLHQASFELSQAEDYLRKRFTSIGDIQDEATSFKIKLKQGLTRVVNHLIIQVTKDFVKGTMPIGYQHMAGLFGIAKYSTDSARPQIQAFILETLRTFNTQITEKATQWSRLQRETFHGDERSSPEQFEAFLNTTFTELKTAFRKTILEYLYEQLCSPAVKLRINKAVTIGYSLVTVNDDKLFATTVEDPHIAGMHELSEGEGQSWDRIVRNTNGRTRKEVVIEIGEKTLKNSSIKWNDKTNFATLTEAELATALENSNDAVTLKKVLQNESFIGRQKFLFLLGTYKAQFCTNNGEEDMNEIENNADGRTQKEVILEIGEKALKNSSIDWNNETNFATLTEAELLSVLENAIHAATFKQTLKKESFINRKKFTFLLGTYKVQFCTNNVGEDFMNIVESDRGAETIDVSLDENGFEEYMALKETSNI